MDSVGAMQDNSDNNHDDNMDDDNSEVRDLAEPVTRPRLRDCVRNGRDWTSAVTTSPSSWTGDDTFRGRWVELPYREWQLHGSDFGGAGRPWGLPRAAQQPPPGGSSRSTSK